MHANSIIYSCTLLGLKTFFSRASLVRYKICVPCFCLLWYGRRLTYCCVDVKRSFQIVMKDTVIFSSRCSLLFKCWLFSSERSIEPFRNQLTVCIQRVLSNAVPLVDELRDLIGLCIQLAHWPRIFWQFKYYINLEMYKNGWNF